MGLIKLDIQEIHHYSERCLVHPKLYDGLCNGILILENLSIELESIFDTVKLIHNLSSEEKTNLTIENSKGVRGFFSVNQTQSDSILTSRKYCSFELGANCGTCQNEIESILRTDNMLPQDLAIQHGINALNKKFGIIADNLRKAISLCLGQHTAFLSEKSNKECSQIRLLEYQPIKNNKDDYKLGSHTDYECFTLILQSVNGLEVLPSNDSNWAHLPDTKNSLILLVGDMLEVYSNGTFQSCLHRTIACSVIRYSIVYFAGLNFDTKVESLPKFGKSKYDSIIFGIHLIARTLENYEHLRNRYNQGLYNFEISFGEGNPFKKSKLTTSSEQKG